MQSFIRTSVIGLLALCGTGMADGQTFEGVVHVTVTDRDGSRMKMNWMIKDQRARIEMVVPGEKTRSIIVNAQTHTMIIPIPERKAYMEATTDVAGPGAVRDALKDTRVERTGKSDRVAGYPCEIWLVRNIRTKRTEHEICVSKGFGRAASVWLDPKDLQRGPQPAWLKQLVDEGGFGLRSMSFDETGDATSRMEVVEIEKKTVDAGMFTVPSDWTKQDLPAMQDNMKAMQQGLKSGQDRPGKPSGQGDLPHAIQEMQRRQAEREQKETTAGEPPPDLNEAVKKLEEMLKQRKSAE